MVNKRYIFGIAIVFLIISLIPATFAAPDIYGHGNNKSNNDTPSIYVGDTIRFNATANETLDPWRWYVDDVINRSGPSGTSDIFDYTFNVVKTYTIKVNGSNGSNESNPISWIVTVQNTPSSPSKPNLTDWNNTKTYNNSQNIVINRTEAVTFSATPNQTIDTWHWYVNGTQESTAINFPYTFNIAGTPTISVNATNANGTSDTIIWNINVVDNDPPANITISNVDSGTTWIKWTWPTPIDIDFSYVKVYLNNIFMIDIYKPTYSYNNTTLLPKTSYNISLRPVDLSGNIGNWTNGSASTIAQKPIITRKSPMDTVFDTLGIETKTFVIEVDQISNVTWKIGNTAQPNPNMTISGLVNFTFKPSDKGSYNISVSANNENGTSNIISWNWSVRPTTFSSGNRIWDGSKPDDFSLTYSWNPMSFSGFYYNAKDDVGTENITITLEDYSSRTIKKNKLVYKTSPQEVSFAYSKFGKYQVIGFMAEKYFAGYTANTTSEKTRPNIDFSGISALSGGGLHKVLLDDDTKRQISVGGTLALKDGYVLKATDIDLNARKMLLSLLKDGNEVDVTTLSSDETYVYTKTVGGTKDLPLIMVRFEDVFSGQELQVAFLKGMFQISEDATVVKTGNKFRNLEVTSVGENGIEMENKANIGISKGTTVDIMGDVKIKVANNDSVVRYALTVEKTGNFEVRSTVYRDSTPLVWTPYNFGMNIGDTSVGFLYDLDDGVGSEQLKLLSTVSGRSIPDKGLEYSTSPQEVKFNYAGFGKYEVIGFMADKYFAGYTSNTGKSSSGVAIITRPSTDFDGISALSHNNLHKVLIDDDSKRQISVGGTLALKDGYVLKATDIDLKGRKMLLALLKDGNEVDVSPLSSGETYVYTKTVGGTQDLPLIMVRFEDVFSGQELQVAFLKGMFQISENPTTVKTGDKFGKMEVTGVGQGGIEMSNDGSIGLSRNANNALMGNIRLKVADNDAALRFYFAVDVTSEMMANQLVINVPAKAMAGDTIKIKVTAGGNPMEKAYVTLDSEIGETDKDGNISYTIPKNLIGTYNITATKTGYEKATKNIEIEKYVDYRLSIEAPSLANQFETITIKVLYNGTAMSGADVLFDNKSIGTTNSNGEVTYTLESSGAHSITASKRTYITVSRDIEVRAPYSEYKALDINITPNPGFAGEEFLVRSNITNVGTKKDTLPVELIINGSAVENKSVTLEAGEKVEVNFTRKEAQASNVTVEILGQSMLYEVKENPTNWLLIGTIITGIGAVIIYVLTSKGILSMEILKQKYELLIQKFNLLFKK